MRLVRSGGMLLTSRLVVSTMGAYWRAHLLIGAHQVGHVTGELVACHVVDQQRDGPEALAQAQCPVGGELATADQLSKPNIERAAILVNRVLPPLERPNSTA